MYLLSTLFLIAILFHIRQYFFSIIAADILFTINQPHHSPSIIHFSIKNKPTPGLAGLPLLYSLLSPSPAFKAYFRNKLAQGKHYNVAISHVAKKLIQVLFHLLQNNEAFDEDRLR